MGQQTLGLVVPYSPEYKISGTNRTLLGELARLTGGGELPGPVAAFVHNLPAADLAREIWGTLLLIAALLFPLDVAVRRVTLGARDFRQAVAWLRKRLPARGVRVGGRERALGRLFQARARAREQSARAEGSPSPEVRPGPPATPGTDAREEPGEAPAELSPPSAVSPSAERARQSLARLREAKKRSRRER